MIPEFHSIFFVCSFGAGLLGSIVYIRMLGSSVDSMADGAKGLVKYVSLNPLFSDFYYLYSIILHDISKF